MTLQMILLVWLMLEEVLSLLGLKISNLKFCQTIFLTGDIKIFFKFLINIFRQSLV
nr:MAG TPA: hypothetical protein [Caudoviricetes sp.]